METNDFGITQNILNNFKVSYDDLKVIFIDKVFTEKYNVNLIKKYFSYIKNIVNNK